jgi:hypothetical protein
LGAASLAGHFREEVAALPADVRAKIARETVGFPEKVARIAVLFSPNTKPSLTRPATPIPDAI